MRGFPTGKETGSFLTIDLGGTNLRVCWITLPGNGNKATVVQDSYRLPNAIKTGQAEDLWGLVTQFLGDFIEKHKLKSTDGRPYVINPS